MDINSEVNTDKCFKRPNCLNKTKKSYFTIQWWHRRGYFHRLHKASPEPCVYWKVAPLKCHDFFSKIKEGKQLIRSVSSCWKPLVYLHHFFSEVQIIVSVIVILFVFRQFLHFSYFESQSDYPVKFKAILMFHDKWEYKCSWKVKTSLRTQEGHTTLVGDRPSPPGVFTTSIYQVSTISAAQRGV